MTFRYLKPLVATALLSALGLAHAETITFDALTTADEYRYTTDTYVDTGFEFISTHPTNGYSLFTWGTTATYSADPTGAALSQFFVGEAMNVRRTGGGSFTLGSFDLSDMGNTADGGIVELDYTDATGKHTQLLTLDNTAGLQTFDLGLTGVKSFALGKDSVGFQIDNINVGSFGPDATAVPEPQSLALLLSGALLLVGVARRRMR
jgi:hypothetical protein